MEVESCNKKTETGKITPNPTVTINRKIRPRKTLEELVQEEGWAEAVEKVDGMGQVEVAVAAVVVKGDVKRPNKKWRALKSHSTYFQRYLLVCLIKILLG